MALLPSLTVGTTATTGIAVVVSLFRVVIHFIIVFVIFGRPLCQGATLDRVKTTTTTHTTATTGVAVVVFCSFLLFVVIVFAIF